MMLLIVVITQTAVAGGVSFCTAAAAISDQLDCGNQNLFQNSWVSQSADMTCASRGLVVQYEAIVTPASFLVPEPLQASCNVASFHLQRLACTFQNAIEQGQRLVLFRHLHACKAQRQNIRLKTVSQGEILQSVKKQ